MSCGTASHLTSQLCLLGELTGRNRECLMEDASSVAMSLKCPSCGTYLPLNAAGPSSTNQVRQTPNGAAILAKYSNEGGVQTDLNIMDSITEEAYIQNHPEARPARAFQVMCSEGDVGGIVDLLQDASGEGADVGELIRYQDPLAEMKSGLHLAVENQQEEVVWLLLWLSSTVPSESFPEMARQSAESMGLGRLHVDAAGDVRGLRDSQGRDAETMAQQSAGSLAGLLNAGVLTP